MIDPQTMKIILRALFFAGALFVTIIPWIPTNPDQTLRHDEGQIVCGFFGILLGAALAYIGATL